MIRTCYVCGKEFETNRTRAIILCSKPCRRQKASWVASSSYELNKCKANSKKIITGENMRILTELTKDSPKYNNAPEKTITLAEYMESKRCGG